MCRSLARLGKRVVHGQRTEKKGSVLVRDITMIEIIRRRNVVVAITAIRLQARREPTHDRLVVSDITNEKLKPRNASNLATPRWVRHWLFKSLTDPPAV